VRKFYIREVRKDLECTTFPVVQVPYYRLISSCLMRSSYTDIIAMDLIW
jgi:hypothetical protein